MLDFTLVADPRALAPDAALPASGGQIRAKGLTYERCGKRLIDTVDLQLDPRRFTVVMGQNGAGKSLLLRLLHGLVEPTSGTLEHGNAPIADVREHQAMVFQKPVLLRRSVGENIGFALRLQRRDSPQCREALLAEVGLADRMKQPARLLSGGEQQRLALARALASNPEVLFLDEPTASLDPASTLLIEETVLRVHRSGVKIVFVSHDIGQARRLADDVVLLHRGRVAEHSQAEQFFNAPATEAARAFLEGRIYL